MRCNGLVRFDSMLALAGRLGAARLATGHYARIADDREGPLVRRPPIRRRTRATCLPGSPADELERLSFPLGVLEKPRVRELARQAGLPVADKRESQDLCFLAGTDTRDFMRRHGAGRRPGPELGGEIVDRDGTVLGRHDGHHGFTVGQRRGIGVSAPEPLYVVAKDARRNRVVVGPRSALATSRVRLSPVGLHRGGAEVESVRLRYGAPAIGCAPPRWRPGHTIAWTSSCIARCAGRRRGRRPA